MGREFTVNANLMKRSILILMAVLLPVFAQAEEPMQLARMNPYVLGAGVVSASVATDSCTGGLLFSWHLENADVTLGGIAGGVNNGCSVGGTTAMTASAAVLDTAVYKTGIKSGQFPTATDNFNFAVSSNDIVKPSAGTLDLWVYSDTFASGSTFFQAYTDANNLMYGSQQTVTVNQFRFIHKAGGTERTATTTFATGFSEDTWYHVIIKWDETVHGSAYTQICADTTDGTANCGTATGEISGWTGDMATLYIGEARGTGSVTNVDDVKIYDMWK